MYWLKHGRIFFLRVYVCGRRNGNSACAPWTQVRKNVAKQVRADHYVKMLRHTDKICRQDIDMVLVDVYVWVVFSYFRDSTVPIRHGMVNAVRLGGRCKMLLRTPLG
ncbi:hypothetical protein D3C84_830390 [compost metagenome]